MGPHTLYIMEGAGALILALVIYLVYSSLKRA
jgi:hypothetical protein